MQENGDNDDDEPWHLSWIRKEMQMSNNPVFNDLKFFIQGQFLRKQFI